MTISRFAGVDMASVYLNGHCIHVLSNASVHLFAHMRVTLQCPCSLSIRHSNTCCVQVTALTSHSIYKEV